MHKAKLNGKFELNIKDNYEDHTRIRAFANDKLAFFIHKNGHFMTKLERTPTVAKLKKQNDDKEYEMLRKKFSNLEEELALKKEQKKLE